MLNLDSIHSLARMYPREARAEVRAQILLYPPVVP